MMTIARWIYVLLIAVALGGADVPVASAAPEVDAAENWRVLEKHGRVRYRPVGERFWWTARTGTEIPGGSSVAADGNGFLIIARAGESITVHPHSRLELPGGPSGDQVQQAAGDLRYRITRAPDRRFAVRTPYLSLLVKGTVFDVAVDDGGAEVEVTEGRVRVDSPSGQVVELSPGTAHASPPPRDPVSRSVPNPNSPFAPAPTGRGRTSVSGPAPGPSQTRNAPFSKAAAKSDPPSGNNGNGNGGGKNK